MPANAVPLSQHLASAWPADPAAPAATAQWQSLAWVADRTHDAVMLCDAQRLITWVNPAFTRLTGFTHSEAVGLLPEELLSGTHTDASTMAHINQQLSQGQSVDRIEVCHHHKDGEPFWVARSVHAVREANGAIAAHIDLLCPQGERRRAETEHTHRLAAELALASKVEFLSRMSQSMRSPLNTVLGFAQLLDMAEALQLPDPQRGHVRHIHTAGQQLLSLLEETLHCARVDDHLLDMRPERLELSQLLRQVRGALEPDALAKDITMVVDASSAEVWADAQHTCSVLFKLVANAIQYSPHGATVWLRSHTTLDGHMGIASVEDSGRGIDHRDLPRLFQPFTRFGDGAAPTQGNGLGLAVSQRLAELMHGHIEVRSTLGQGSVFSLHLPLAPKPAFVSPPPEQAGDEASIAVTPPLIDLPALRVVHIEDNVLNQSLVEALFSSYPQIKLHTSDTAAEGLTGIETLRPDVALIDINLPDGSGLDLCRRLRAQAAFKKMPLIALSADALPDHIAKALQTGFDHYLVKPLQIERLLTILSTLSPSTPTHPSR